MQILGCHHTGITVRNLDRSVAWYCDMFGFTVQSTFESQGAGIEQITGIAGAHLKGAQLQLGSYFLELIEYLAPKGKDVDLTTSNVGNSHFGLLVDDVHEAYQTLKAKGVRIKGAPTQSRPGRPTVVYFVDPDGIPLELVQAPK